MTRQRKDPRLELARLLVLGTARPRYDRRGGEAAPRRRVDPRAGIIAQMVAAGPRLRLDRGQRAGPVTGMAPTQATSPGTDRVVSVEDPAFWVLVFADPGDGRLSPGDRQVLGAARQLAGTGGGVVLAAEGPPADAGSAGADRVIALPKAAHPEDRAQLALALIEALRPRHVLAAETGDGGDLARRIAVERGQALFAGVEQISARGVVRALPGRGLDGDDGVAGVDRALEGVAAFDRHQVGDLVDAQQRGDDRHQVLAEGRRRREDVAVAGGELRDLRAEHLGEGLFVGRVGDGQHFRHAGDGGGLGRGACRIGREYRDVDGGGRQRLRCGDGLGGRAGVEGAVEVLGDDEDFGHGVLLGIVAPVPASRR